jgi:hypothetical protein
VIGVTSCWAAGAGFTGISTAVGGIFLGTEGVVCAGTDGVGALRIISIGSLSASSSRINSRLSCAHCISKRWAIKIIAMTASGSQSFRFGGQSAVSVERILILLV